MCDCPLLAISGIDGRYAAKCKRLKPYFSEYGLIRYRTLVEIEWILTTIGITDRTKTYVRRILDNFSVEHAKRVKEVESVTNHDVKAVEYMLKEYLDGDADASKLKELVHFCCTSEDINNLAYARILKDSLNEVIVPRIEAFLTILSSLSVSSADSPLLALTHGQAATPTTFGREMAVFIHRLKRQLSQLNLVEICGKFNGATGSFNAHMIAYPDIDWPSLSRRFVEQSIGVHYQPMSTQIECHDHMGELSDVMARISTILIGFSRDLWMYISRGVLKLRVSHGEVGSSTMPHKVNPIDFENAEGNLGISASLFNHFSSKLLISRLQRDLSDSTVLRTLGSAFAHFMIALDSLTRGLEKVQVNSEACDRELDENWAVIGEAVQIVMRKHGLAKPYERLKDFTRGREIDENSMRTFISSLKGELPDSEIDILSALTPRTYIGLAPHLANQYGRFP